MQATSQQSRTVTPLADRVVIRRVEQEGRTRGGIYIPDTAKEKPQEGEVVAVGPGRVTDKGKRIPMTIEVGDRVVFAKFGGTEIKDGNEELVVLRESDVLAKIV